jgi:hypothetical protein
MPSGSAPEADGAASGAKPRWRVWLRFGLGIAILVVVALWVVREGDYLRNLSLRVLAVSTVLSVLTVLLNGRTLQAVAATYGRSLAFADALRLSGFASIGNAAGGLPLGTALKFSVLHERVGLRLAEIAAGMATFTVGIALSLMLFAALSVAASEAATAVKVLALAACGGAVAVVGSAGVFLGRHHRLSALAARFADPRHLARCAALSFLVAGSFVLNSCATGLLLLPAASLNDLLFISSAGILLGLLTLLQGVAGIQELAMALASLAVGVTATDGAQIALTLRASALAGAGLVLLAQRALGRAPQRGTGR